MVSLHTICSLLSYGAFLVACVAAVLFLVQERQLKRKTLGALFHGLPSLGALDRANFLAIGAGFGLLTLGMLCGLASVRATFGRWWLGDPKEYLTVALWGAYCALWLVRLRSTLRGRRLALLSVLGFSLVLFTFVGLSHLLPSAHPYLGRDVSQLSP
ncbi:MAG: hypothetical protein COV75_03710 [Candidatus Omnitrophica bacterium CG11_big_fil_rev_8_21_14_0_20_63_9]|nr:MAG: hypothetical protein COV75_03710 [Candidatus Omnitrophica bacterium CG11_big_fil_rev_8_21_14_0_20_63_9]